MGSWSLRDSLEAITEERLDEIVPEGVICIYDVSTTTQIKTHQGYVVQEQVVRLGLWVSYAETGQEIPPISVCAHIPYVLVEDADPGPMTQAVDSLWESVTFLALMWPVQQEAREIEKEFCAHDDDVEDDG